MLLPYTDSPAMQTALNAAAQAGREAGYALRQPPVVREQWRCLNLAGMYRQGRDFERARLFVQMSREWRLGRDDGHLRRFSKQSARVLGMGLTALNGGEGNDEC